MVHTELGQRVGLVKWWRRRGLDSDIATEFGVGLVTFVRLVKLVESGEKELIEIWS